MSGRMTQIVAGVAVFGGAIAGCSSAPGSPTPDDQWQQSAQSLFSDTVEETGIPGGAIAISRGGSRWEYSTADLGQVYAYRSVTKSFVGTAILVLEDSGQLRLDDPISDYVEGVPQGSGITLRMLLGMRSGIANYSATAPFQEALGKDLTKTWTDDELLGFALSEPLNFAPDAQYEYSNTNTVLLGKVLESVTDLSWEDAVGELVLEPLGLSSVTYGPVGDAALPFQVSPDLVAEELPAVSPALFSAAGGLFGNITDLHKWAEALGEGALLESATAADRTQNPSATSVDSASPLYDGYGLGLGILDGWVGHTGVGLGYQSLAMFDSVTGDSVAIVLNGTGEDPDVPARLFSKIIDSWE